MQIPPASIAIRWNRIITGFALMALLMAAPAAKAASERCSGNGFSVWCHRYWWGYTQCNLYDKTGDLVSEHVSPQDSCQEIQ